MQGDYRHKNCTKNNIGREKLLDLYKELKIYTITRDRAIKKSF